MPLFSSLAGYDRSWLRGDLLAGMTVWAVLVPEALAYASIAGVSPVVGLYAAPGALLLYAAFGSSRHLVVGPMSATAALSAAAVADVATQGSTGFALTIVAGQLPDLLGVEGAGGNFFERLWGVLADLGQTSATTLLVGLASLALVLGLRRVAPRGARLAGRGPGRDRGRVAG